MSHKVGDLVLGGFGLGMITKVEFIGDCHIEWYYHNKDALRTRFYYEEVTDMKVALEKRRYAQGR